MTTALGHTTKLLAAILLLPLVACNKTLTQSTPEPSRTTVEPLQGEYLSVRYIDELTATHSPLRAGKSEEIDLILVFRNGNRTLLSPSFNFHEGGNTFAIRSDGTVVPIDGDADELANLNAVVLDSKTLQFGYAPDKPTKYMYVKKAAEYVGRVVLAGKYKDRRGRDYEFRGDGWAVFPDRKFKFEAGLDHVMDNFDYFDEKDGTKDVRTWAFRWNRDVLEILRTREIDDSGFDEIADPHPVLQLRRIK